MPETVNLYLGFDPGGVGHFGWSICREVAGQLEPPAKTGLANNARDALNRVSAAIAPCAVKATVSVLAAGIDAPLFWSSTGGRVIDNQATLGVAHMAVNSLPGSVVVQGPLLVRHLRDVWDDLKITESYPKALEHLLKQGGHPKEYQMMQRLTAGLNANRGENHKRDATLCAVSAWAATRQPANWQNLYPLESCPINPFAIPVSYWMPIP